MATHPGIEIRIRTEAGTLLQLTSDVLHWQGALTLDDPETWRQLVRGVDGAGLVIEYRPVVLADPVGDEDQDHDGELSADQLAKLAFVRHSWESVYGSPLPDPDPDGVVRVRLGVGLSLEIPLAD